MVESERRDTKGRRWKVEMETRSRHGGRPRQRRSRAREESGGEEGGSREGRAKRRVRAKKLGGGEVGYRDQVLPVIAEVEDVEQAVPGAAHQLPRSTPASQAKASPRCIAFIASTASVRSGPNRAPAGTSVE